MPTSDHPTPENDQPVEDALQDSVEQLKKSEEQVAASEAAGQKAKQSAEYIKALTWLQQRIPSWKRISIKTVEERVQQIFSILVRGLSGLVALLLIIGSLRGIFSHNYIFQDFTVPENYEKIGISGEVLKNKIIHKANTLVENKDLPFSDKDSSIPDQDIEIMGVSINALFGMMRSAMHQSPTFIVGNLIEHQNELTLELNINQENTETERETEIIAVTNCASDTKRCIDEIIESAAYWLLSFEEPYPSAKYYFKEGKIKKAKNTIEAAIPDLVLNKPADSLLYSKMYNLWGETLSSFTIDAAQKHKPNNKQAKEKYCQAINVGANAIPQAWANLADVEWELHRSIYEKWGQNQDTISRADSLRLDTIMSYYTRGEEQHQLFIGKKDTVDAYFSPQFKPEVELFVKLRDGEITPTLQLDSTDFKAIISNEYEDLLGLAEQFLQSKQYNIVFDAYIQYLNHIREQEENDKYENLLYDLVGKDHPFLAILKTAQKIYSNPTAKIPEIRYHQLIERLAYFDWEYDIFDFDYVEEDVLPEETDFPYPQSDADTFLWSELSIIPDPQLSGGALDATTEKLWYFLHQRYNDADDLSDEKYFVTKSTDYLKAVNAFFTTKGSGPAWYRELHNGREYRDWSRFRQGKTFVKQKSHH